MKQSIGGRIQAFAATALAVLLMGTLAFAGGVGQGMFGRGGGSSNVSGWLSGVTAGNVTVSGILGDQLVVQIGSSSQNHGAVIKSYSNPSVINAMEFRNPGDATLRGYFYPMTTVVALAQGPTVFENAANRGSITLAAGTGTATVLSGTKCVCTDSTANASVKCVVAATTLTATGTGTDVITYLCF